MVQFNFTYDPGISLEQRIGFDLAARIWGEYLTDDITVNLHVVSTDYIQGNAIGGAIPILHEQHYGVFTEYLEQDITPSGSDNNQAASVDEQAINSLQVGNTVDVVVNGEVVDGNTQVMLTSAQAKALGMDDAIALDNGTTWNRDLVDAAALDGYIVINQSYDWNYDFLREGEAPESTLDFLTLALHEIGHQLGFISGLDGLLDINQLHSGETQVGGITALDLFRHTVDSTAVGNPDGAVSDLTLGANAYFSVDGGATELGLFSTGQAGDGFQAGHWKRMKDALGIMDPTLAYQERLSLTELDLQAIDALGYDVNYGALSGLDMEALLHQSEMAVAYQLGIDTGILTGADGGENGLYQMGYQQWWQIFEAQILELGYGEWWQILELGYGLWFQESALLELDYGTWFQQFEQQLLDLGYGTWFQQFESTLLDLGYGQWWQLLELGYGQWWQNLETYFSTLETVYDVSNNTQAEIVESGVGGDQTALYQGGGDDDILGGTAQQDRIQGRKGDDLIDGEAGHDVLWGNEGRDMLYGHTGNDLIYGGQDDDLVLGEDGNDDLYGQTGHDIVSGGSGDDIVSGGKGHDDLKGGRGHDVVSGDAGDDLIDGGADSDILIGGDGRDQVNGGSGDDTIYGDELAETEAATLQELRRQLQQQATDAPANPGDDGTTSSTHPLRIEAEDMTLSGNYIIHTGFYNDSGDSVRTTSTATATTTFTGETGRYLVFARYFDEADGQGALAVDWNGYALDSWTLNQDDDRYYTRTVAQDVYLSSGDQFTVTATAGGGDYANFDYLEFVSLDNLIVTELDSSGENSINTTSTTTSTTTSIWSSSGSTSSSSYSSTSGSTSGTTTYSSFYSSTSSTGLRIEAENMSLIGDYSAASYSFASGDQLIEVANQGQGKALTAFSGEAGFYDIVIGYHDENDDGIAQLSTSLNGVVLDDWSLDQNLSSAEASSFNFVTRTVASGVILSEGDVFAITGLRGEGNQSDEAARVDYVEFVRVDAPMADEADTVAAVLAGEPVRIEAESMSLSGYSTEYQSVASDNALIRTSSSGTAMTAFTGSSGYYNIEITYYDESDGLATLSASLAEVELDEWQLNQALGNSLVGEGNRVTRAIATQIQVNNGDILRLEGSRDYNEFARIDYVEFIPVSAPTNAGSDSVETNSDDVLQGGTGSDVVIGGDGNDIIYGEDQRFTASSLLSRGQTYNDILMGNSGDDVIYGQAGNDALYGDELSGEDSGTLTDGLVGHWSFDEASGTVASDTTGTNSGSLTNMSGSQWTTGRFGGALEFDGSNDRVTVADDARFDMTNTLTLSTWVNADAFASWTGLITKGTSNIPYGLSLRSDGRLAFQANFGSVTGGNGSDFQYSTVALSAGQWHHVAVTYDGSNLQFYIDGQLDSTHQTSITFGSNNQDLVIGADLTGSHFNGTLDDARVYHRALAAEEIDQLAGTQSVAYGMSDGAEGGNDALVGGVGNDSLVGGAGNDSLNGTDAVAVGYLERDTLTGGSGADLFILGDAAGGYYLGGGGQDYALIKDFSAAIDTLQLFGSADNYHQQQQGNNLQLFYSGDLVAVLENVSSVNLSGSGFSYV